FRVLSMIGLPDAIGNFTGEVSDVLDAVKGQFKEVRVVLDALNPLEDILIWFAREAFGIDVNQWKEFVVSPERYINCEDTPVGLGYTIGLDENTSAYLSELMRVPSVDYGCGDPAKEDFVPFDPGEFEPFYNTVVMSKLLLLDGEELNRLLYDHHVGALFDESTWYDREAPRPNLGLGWIATLDGNHQWRETAPAHAPNAEEPFSVDGEGMPLWVDCLARKRVFRYSEEFGTGLFKDWTGTGENELGDHGENCRGDSVKLPPIEFEMKLLKPNGEEEIAPFEEVCFGCLVVLRLLNHQDQGTEQDYVVYVRAHDEADGRVVFHHAEPGSVAGYDTSQHEILFRACDGVYDVHGFLFQNMLSWDVADPITSPPIQPVPPDLPMPVASPQTGNVWVTTDPRRCPTRTTVCTEFPVPGSTSASWLGGGCTESQEVESEVDCADEPLLADDECADTDQDGIPDIWDNCPTVFNPYQTEIAGCGGPAQIPEHIVDLAELYVDDPRVGEVMDFLDGVLPQFRGLEPWCLTCDSVFDSIEPSLAAFSRDFMSGSVSQDRYVADVASLVIGPVIRGPDVRIRQAAIEDRRGAATLRMDLDSRATGRMTIVVPHSILRGGGITGTAFDVLVDGRPTTFTQMNSLQATTFEFTTQRASQIAIVGVETGPQADTALDGAFKLASRINSLFRERP
nr:thrombospondin type 3 repeat-containing protein [Acidimicrobiia bacterium]